MKFPRRLITSLLIIIFAGGQVALSQTLSVSEPPPTPSACVAPGAFSSCVQLVASNFTACDAAALNLPTDYDRENGELECYSIRLESLLSCYLSSCWNEVYSCAYQWVASELYAVALSGAIGTSIPYYPAPDNAPGGCSCNVGKLFETVFSALAQQGTTCGVGASSPADVGGCICCTASAAFAAFYAFCPNTDANAILLPTYVSAAQNGPILSQCSGAYYDAATCEEKYGLAPAAGGLALSVNSLPAWTGTNPLSTLGGTITSPPSGSVLTWTGVNGVYTNTAATAGFSSLSGSGVLSTTTNPAPSSTRTVQTTQAQTTAPPAATSPALSSIGTFQTTQAQTTAPPAAPSPALSSIGTFQTTQAQTTTPPAATSPALSSTGTIAPTAITTSKTGSSTKAKINFLLWISLLGRLGYTMASYLV